MKNIVLEICFLELVTCHHCQGFADMESCDSMPVYECQQKQVNFRHQQSTNKQN